MNRIKFFGFFITSMLTFGACEEKVMNPGDFSLPTELEVVHIYDTLGNEYPVQVHRSIDTTFTAGTKTARYVELVPVVIAAQRNEIHIDLKSNARWQAPTPDFQGKIAWYLTQNVNGGGDATIKVKILAGLATKRRPVLAQQYIYSRDSLVMYKLVFDQKAQNE